MKVNYTLKPLPVRDFEEWRREQGLKVEVVERSPMRFPTTPLYYAHIVGGEVKEGGTLAGVIGNGDTPEDAIRNLAYSLEGEILVINAFAPSRREIPVPHTLKVDL